MMNTRYFTFILRMRFEDHKSQGSDGEKVSGSLQLAGLQEFCYFDSLVKLQEILQELVVRAILPSQARGDDS